MSDADTMEQSKMGLKHEYNRHLCGIARIKNKWEVAVETKRWRFLKSLFETFSLKVLIWISVYRLCMWANEEDWETVLELICQSFTLSVSVKMFWAVTEENYGKRNNEGKKWREQKYYTKRKKRYHNVYHIIVNFYLYYSNFCRMIFTIIFTHKL